MNERPSTYELTMERTLAAPPERVFRAWTEPVELARWFAPNPELPTEAEVDLRVGVARTASAWGDTRSSGPS